MVLPRELERLVVVVVALTTALAGPGATALNAGPSCVVVRDAASAQDVRIEPHGANAVRVRAVVSGGRFVDDPDVVSAFTPLPAPGGGGGGGGALELAAAGVDGEGCAAVDLGSSAAGTSVTSGNIKAAVGPDGRLTFTRVSDSKVLLTEKDVRALTPTTTVPPVSPVAAN